VYIQWAYIIVENKIRNNNNNNDDDDLIIPFNGKRQNKLCHNTGRCRPHSEVKLHFGVG